MDKLAYLKRSHYLGSIVSQPVEKNIGVWRDDFALIDFAHSTVVELVPLLAQEILAVGRVVPPVETPVMVDYSIQVVNHRFACLISCIVTNVHSK